MSWEQLSLSLESTETPPAAAVAASEASAGSLVPREAGWTLLGDPDTATNLWHRIASQRFDGTMVALCGAQGRFIEEAEHEIICCSACSAWTPPT